MPHLPDLQLVQTSVKHRIRSFTARMDAVGMVFAGRKRVSWTGNALSFEAGDVFVIPCGCRLDVVNDPAGRPAYEARVLVFPPELIEAFQAECRDDLDAPLSPAVAACSRLRPAPELRDAFVRAVAAAVDPATSPFVRRLRAFEVLFRLAEAGLPFAPPKPLSWSERVRRVVLAAPECPWPVARLAAQLHLGASTLQRRLAEEGTTASDCVREARLDLALGLLQAGRLSVAEIAYACGYAAHGRFSLAFRDRFGFTPSALRPVRGGAHRN